MEYLRQDEAERVLDPFVTRRHSAPSCAKGMHAKAWFVNRYFGGEAAFEDLQELGGPEDENTGPGKSQKVGIQTVQHYDQTPSAAQTAAVEVSSPGVSTPVQIPIEPADTVDPLPADVFDQVQPRSIRKTPPRAPVAASRSPPPAAELDQTQPPAPIINLPSSLSKMEDFQIDACGEGKRRHPQTASSSDCQDIPKDQSHSQARNVTANLEVPIADTALLDLRDNHPADNPVHASSSDSTSVESTDVDAQIVTSETDSGEDEINDAESDISMSEIEELMENGTKVGFPFMLRPTAFRDMDRLMALGVDVPYDDAEIPIFRHVRAPNEPFMSLYSPLQLQKRALRSNKLSNLHLQTLQRTGPIRNPGWVPQAVIKRQQHEMLRKFRKLKSKLKPIKPKAASKAKVRIYPLSDFGLTHGPSFGTFKDSILPAWRAPATWFFGIEHWRDMEAQMEINAGAWRGSNHEEILVSLGKFWAASATRMVSPWFALPTEFYFTIQRDYNEGVLTVPGFNGHLMDYMLSQKAKGVPRSKWEGTIDWNHPEVLQGHIPRRLDDLRDHIQRRRVFAS